MVVVDWCVGVVVCRSGCGVTEHYDDLALVYVTLAICMHRLSLGVVASFASLPVFGLGLLFFLNTHY